MIRDATLDGLGTAIATGYQGLQIVCPSAMIQNLAQPTTEPVANLDEVGNNRAMPSMSIAMWVAIGAGLFGLAMTLLLFKRSAGRMDLGTVSEQWMAQHRAGRIDDPQHH